MSRVFEQYPTEEKIDVLRSKDYSNQSIIDEQYEKIQFLKFKNEVFTKAIEFCLPKKERDKVTKQINSELKTYVDRLKTELSEEDLIRLIY